jgi:hypothetical protein
MLSKPTIEALKDAEKSLTFVLSQINTVEGDRESHHKALFELREDFREITIKLIKGEKL